MAVKVEDLYVSYGDTTILRNISLHVPRGSFSCIIGPNGCGKSTLLKAVSRNIQNDKGRILIHGKQIESYNTRILSREMAFLAQSPQTPEQFSVAELVGYGRYPHLGWMGMLREKDYKVIRWAMGVTEVSEFEDRELVHLSGGERQRVRIAMALAQEAGILLLDEPTTYLDIAHQFHTLELIKKLNREMGITILMVLHDLNQAARYADYLFVINKGEMYDWGKPDQVINTTMLRDVFHIKAQIFRDSENDCPFFIPIKGLDLREKDVG